MNPFLVLGKDGKPMFIGAEDKHNPPVSKPTIDPVICPQCHLEVDHLLGDIKPGCESCYKPELDKREEVDESYDENQRII